MSFATNSSILLEGNNHRSCLNFGNVPFRAHAPQLLTDMYFSLTICGLNNFLRMESYILIAHGGPPLQGVVSDTGGVSEVLAVQGFE